MDKGRILLELARASLEEAFGGPAPELPAHSFLEEPGACFVTLKRKDGELRGCIGSLRPRRSLFEDVKDNAKASAFEDPRFSPVLCDELEGLRIEISVLSPLEPLEVEDEADACRKLRRGVDGVHLSWGGRGALFIPKMWEQLPDPRRFLFHLKRKAGLPAEWMPGTRLLRFTAELFEESDERGAQGRPLVAQAR